MLFTVIVTILLAGAVIILAWVARGAMLTPVPVRETLSLKIEILAKSGASEVLEQTVISLLWLIENGTLPAKVITIVDDGMDEKSRDMADILSRENQMIEFISSEEKWIGADQQTQNT